MSEHDENRRFLIAGLFAFLFDIYNLGNTNHAKGFWASNRSTGEAQRDVVFQNRGVYATPLIAIIQDLLGEEDQARETQLSDDQRAAYKKASKALERLNLEQLTQLLIQSGVPVPKVTDTWDSSEIAFKIAHRIDDLIAAATKELGSRNPMLPYITKQLTGAKAALGRAFTRLNVTISKLAQGENIDTNTVVEQIVACSKEISASYDTLQFNTQAIFGTESDRQAYAFKYSSLPVEYLEVRGWEQASPPPDAPKRIRDAYSKERRIGEAYGEVQQYLPDPSKTNSADSGITSDVVQDRPGPTAPSNPDFVNSEQPDMSEEDGSITAQAAAKVPTTPNNTDNSGGGSGGSDGVGAERVDALSTGKSGVDPLLGKLDDNGKEETEGRSEERSNAPRQEEANPSKVAAQAAAERHVRTASPSTQGTNEAADKPLVADTTSAKPEAANKPEPTAQLSNKRAVDDLLADHLPQPEQEPAGKQQPGEDPATPKPSALQKFVAAGSKPAEPDKVSQDKGPKNDKPNTVQQSAATVAAAHDAVTAATGEAGKITAASAALESVTSSSKPLAAEPSDKPTNDKLVKEVAPANSKVDDNKSRQADPAKLSTKEVESAEVTAATEQQHKLDDKKPTDKPSVDSPAAQESTSASPTSTTDTGRGTKEVASALGMQRKEIDMPGAPQTLETKNGILIPMVIAENGKNSPTQFAQAASVRSSNIPEDKLDDERQAVRRQFMAELQANSSATEKKSEVISRQTTLFDTAFNLGTQSVLATLKRDSTARHKIKNGLAADVVIESLQAVAEHERTQSKGTNRYVAALDKYIQMLVNLLREDPLQAQLVANALIHAATRWDEVEQRYASEQKAKVIPHRRTQTSVSDQPALIRVA